MYLLAHATTLIDCPPDIAFRYAANLKNFPQWFPGVNQMASIDDLPFDAIGKQYREIFTVPWRGERPVLMRVVEVMPPFRISTEGALPAVLPRMEMEFRHSSHDKCEVEWRMFSRNTRAIARWTLLPIASRLMTRRAIVGMRRLKNRLEGGPQP